MKYLCAWLIMVSSVVCSESASFSANSPSLLDVSNACWQASVGDTVTIPAGAALWTNVLVLTNGIKITGSGTNLTFITNAVIAGGAGAAGYPWPLLQLNITNDKPMRISGISFVLNTNSSTDLIHGKSQPGAGAAIYVPMLSYAENPVLNGLRIDHCSFSFAVDRCIELDGGVYGVIDHCLFYDSALATEPVAGHDKEWSRFTAPFYGLGTTNTIVLEDCLWIYDNNSFFGAPIACGQGGHYVFRHNTITNMSDDNIEGLDLHGNNFYYTDPSQLGWRGSIWTEVYFNTFNWRHITHDAFRSDSLRGGTCMVFSNTMNCSWTSAAIELWEEETYLSSHFNPLVTSWPAQDQITNSFIWGNTIYGTPSNVITFSDVKVSICVTNGRDYWLQDPRGLPHYTNGEGAVDLMAAYNPLVYPHPLVTAQDTSAVIGVSPTSLNFGVLIPGGSSNLTVVVTNSGNAFLDGVVTTSSPFSITGGSPYSVAPSDSSIITITFTPTIGGAASGTATFTGGGGATVSLSGSQIPVTGTKISGNVTISGATVIK